MYNFFHVYKYHLGVLAALLIGIGVIRFPLNLFADTTSFFNATTSSTATYTTTTSTGTAVTFSVAPTTDVDCTIPSSPKTKTAFVVNPATGGSFTLSRGTATEVTSVMPGARLLPNGVYNWSGVVNSHYVGSGILNGKFVLDVTCALSGAGSATTTTSTVTTESVVVTTGSVTVSHDDDDNSVSGGTSSPTSAQTVTVAYQPIPTTTLPQAPSPVTLPGSTTTALPKISLPPPTSPVAQNKVPVPSVGTMSAPPVPSLLPTSIRHDEEGDNDDDKIIRVNVAGVASALPALSVEHFDNFDEKKQKEIVNKISKKEQQEIVNRVKNPAICTDMKECAVYCEQKEARESSTCVTFAQTRVPQPSPIKPSLVGSIPFERLENILDDTTVRPPELPSVVKNPQEFQQFCTDLKNTSVCAQVLIENKLVSSETIVERAHAIKQNNEEEKKIFVERTGARVFIDSDNDELADYDEVNIYHTDPKNGDTDKDGVSDGTEIAVRSNPRSKTPAPSFVARATTTGAVASIVPALTTENNPLISGTTDKKLLMVNEVIATRHASSTVTSSPRSESGASYLTFTGTALPNSFVTLYIFSEPIVVMVRTNSLGEWSYTLDKELPDGTHQVVSAITDGDGRVLAKSEPLPFVKVAEAVTLGNVEVALPTAHKEPGFFSGLSLYSLVVLIIGILSISFLTIGVIVRRRDGGNDTTAMQ